MDIPNKHKMPKMVVTVAAYDRDGVAVANETVTKFFFKRLHHIEIDSDLCYAVLDAYDKVADASNKHFNS